VAQLWAAMKLSTGNRRWRLRGGVSSAWSTTVSLLLPRPCSEGTGRHLVKGPEVHHMQCSGFLLGWWSELHAEEGVRSALSRLRCTRISVAWLLCMKRLLYKCFHKPKSLHCLNYTQKKPLSVAKDFR